MSYMYLFTETKPTFNVIKIRLVSLIIAKVQGLMEGNTGLFPYILYLGSDLLFIPQKELELSKKQKMPRSWDRV